MRLGWHAHQCCRGQIPRLSAAKNSAKSLSRGQTLSRVQVLHRKGDQCANSLFDNLVADGKRRPAIRTYARAQPLLSRIRQSLILVLALDRKERRREIATDCAAMLCDVVAI